MNRLLSAVLLSLFLLTAAPAQAASTCDGGIPALTSGYGANGSYTVERRSVANPAFRRKAVEVFLPKDAPGKRPVIFFSHGYGPGDPDLNADLLNHMASLGYVVVFSGYPMLRASHDERYDSLWRGFVAATTAFADRMDLTRVGFVGHSYGGGATPDMVWRGVVQSRWGSQGAFMMELAPWYSFRITPAHLRDLPKSIVHVVQVYDRDDVNDHRMAIDLYNAVPVDQRYYFLVRSLTVNGCTLTADHAAPGRSTANRMKQYGVFRPLDAVMDAVLNGNAAARTALAAMGTQADNGAYQPLVMPAQPAPIQAERAYRFPWSDSDNLRK